MPEQINVFSQVGALYAECLRNYEPLENFTIVHEESEDEASQSQDGDTIRVDFLGDDPRVALGQGHTDHFAIYEFTIVTRTASSGILSRDACDAIAHIIAAISADRSMGGRLGDTQEVDLGSTEPNGTDANGISIRFRAEFTTSRDDWFTLIASP